MAVQMVAQMVAYLDLTWVGLTAEHLVVQMVVMMDLRMVDPKVAS